LKEVENEPEEKKTNDGEINKPVSSDSLSQKKIPSSNE